MKIISESVASENKELLPQVIQRIFSVCKTDPNFPLKNKVRAINGEVSSLKEKTMRQVRIANKARKSREDLEERLADLEERNQRIKDNLLDFLGSE
jgi:FtsZ-binding cell division protein ZapB